jgi:hypothetical protein
MNAHDDSPAPKSPSGRPSLITDMALRYGGRSFTLRMKISVPLDTPWGHEYHLTQLMPYLAQVRQMLSGPREHMCILIPTRESAGDHAHDILTGIVNTDEPFEAVQERLSKFLLETPRTMCHVSIIEQPGEQATPIWTMLLDLIRSEGGSN